MPKRFPRVAAFFAALAFAFVTAASAGNAWAFQCEPQINQTLQKYSVNQSDVKSVKVVHRTGGAKSSGIYTLDAWVRLNSCSHGALVVNLTKYCMVQHSHTTGDCRVEGVPAY